MQFAIVWLYGVVDISIIPVAGKEKQTDRQTDRQMHGTNTYRFTEYIMYINMLSFSLKNLKLLRPTLTGSVPGGLGTL